jgi:cell division protein FtsN
MEELIMANERNPNDPYRSPDDPYRAEREDELRRAQRLDNEVQIDPELAEGPANGGKIAMFAIAVAVILGAVFYGLNNSTINQAGTAPTSSTAQNTPASPPAAPPGMRDVTPRTNTAPGVTTGAAPARPQTPPSSAPTGTDLNRSGNPPTTDAPGK